jgi:hypothetical protein
MARLIVVDGLLKARATYSCTWNDEIGHTTIIIAS